MNLKTKVLIALNGNIGSGRLWSDLSFFDEKIAVDGGARFFLRYNDFPDLLIGDLDSVNKETLRLFERQGVTIKRFPEKKDFSDFEVALEHVQKKYFSADITIVGFFSNKRIDHFLFNLEVLKKVRKVDFNVSIVDDYFKAFLMHPGEHSFEEVEKGSIVSLLPISNEVFIENSKGLEYEIDNQNITSGSSLSLSNKTKTSRIYLKIREGRLLILIPEEKENL